MMPIAILFAGFFAEREKLFGKIAAAMVIFLTVGTFVGINICEKNSHKATAEIIMPLVDENTCVVSYGRGYVGSLVFYSGLNVYRLETYENIKKLKPSNMKWTTTNVMPFMDFEELPTDKKIIAVVEKNSEQKFFELAKGNWRLVEELPNYEVVVRD
jgi:hypothetical protein